MTDDLSQRLERLAGELVGDALAPPPSSVRRRGGRRRRRQVAGAGLLTVVLAALAIGPGAGLLADRSQRQGPHPSASNPTTTAPGVVGHPPLRTPRARPGEIAVVIQDPPLGLPRELRGKVSVCGEMFSHFMVNGGVSWRGATVNLEIRPVRPASVPTSGLSPFGAVAFDPLQTPGHANDPTLLVEGGDAHFKLRGRDGRAGTLVGPYRLVQIRVPGGRADTVHPAMGAQAAFAWDCGR